MRVALNPVRKLILQPGKLPFGVTPGDRLRAQGGLFLIEVPGKGAAELRHAERLHRRQSGVEPKPVERRNLGKRIFILDHGPEPGVGAGVDFVPGRQQDGLDQLKRWVGLKPGAGGVTLPIEERAAGGAPDLERPGNALAVAGVDPRGNLLIFRREHAVSAGPLRLDQAAHLGADGVRNVRDLGNTFDQRAKVKPGAAHHDGQARLLQCLRNGAARVSRPVGSRKTIRCRTIAVKLVGHACLVPRTRPRGDDSQLPIDLHAVGVDHRALGLFGEPQRQSGLAAGGRSGNENHFIFHNIFVNQHLAPFIQYLYGRSYGPPQVGSRKEFAPMDLVATLIANPARPVVDDDLVARGVDVLRAGGAGGVEARPLALGVAADIYFDGIEPATAADLLRAALIDAPIDIAVLPQDGRRRKLLIADMDSTIITVECIDEIADFAGLKAKVAKITEAAMRGELDFVAALKERAAMLEGLPEDVLEQVFRKRVRLTPGASALIRTMNEAGALTVLVSGGFTFFTERVSALAGFQVNRANCLEIFNGRLTGRVIEPIVDSSTKLASLHEFRVGRGLSVEETLAIGDGANDIPMIEAAGLGVSYHAKPKAAAAADVAICHGDLTAILYLQGFTADEIVG